VSATSVSYSARLPRRSRWFSSVFLKSLRDYRAAILGWGLGLGLLMLIGASAFPTTAEGKLALKALAPGFTWYAEPVAVETPGGYITWRIVPIVGILLAIWALLAGSSTLRGEEESGSLDMLLSLPTSRVRTAIAKIAAIGAASLLAGLLIGLLTAATAGAVQDANYGPADALVLGMNTALLAFFFAALTLFLSQFTRERGAAAGLAGGILGLSFLLDGVGRVVGSEALRRVSPFYYYGLSKPLAPSYGANPGAMAVLLVGALVLSAAAIGIFTRRDLGAPALRLTLSGQRAATGTRNNALPAGDWTLRSVYVRTVRSLATMTFWVAAVVASYGVLATSLTKSTEKLIIDFYKGTPFAGLFANIGSNGDASYIALFFSFLVIAPAIYALMLATRWASAEANGRLELVLSTPQSRARVLLANFAALATAVSLVAVALFAAVGALVVAQGLKVEGVKLVEAVAGMLPIALVVGAVGYLLAGWIPARLLAGVLTLLLVASFFINLLGSALKLPDWALQLSIFQQYGTPLTEGLHWANVLALLAVAAIPLGIAMWRFAQKDIGR
jgi:ABC-2 type transport system permease protein